MALFKKKEKEVKTEVKEDIEVVESEELEVQTTFNTDGLDILNEDGEVENVSN